jgi:hypothetical protein
VTLPDMENRPLPFGEEPRSFALKTVRDGLTISRESLAADDRTREAIQAQIARVQLRRRQLAAETTRLQDLLRGRSSDVAK